MEKAPIALRQKLIYIHPSFLAFGFRGGAYRVASDELPIDVKIVNAGYSEMRNMFYIVIEHDSFEEVKIGDELPLYNGPSFVRLYPGDVV